MQRDVFFDVATSKLGSMSASAMDGANALLDEGERRGTPINQLAYILGTAWWETAKTMQPVREAFFISSNFEKAEKWRRKNLHYYPYYGRGFVQLTWKANYKKASDKLGVDFVSNPDRVMEMQYAVPITFDGMYEGWFTGKALDDYIDDVDEPDNKDLQEYIDARRIINGKDKATTIAKIALALEGALRDAGYAAAAAAFAAPGAAGVVAVAPANGLSRFDEHITKLGLRSFKPYEFLVKGSAHSNPASPAYGLNTDPPENLWGNIDATARVLDELRHRLQRSIVLTSVYRSPAYNDAIGGATDSQHVKFNACDFAVSGSPVGPMQWAAALREMRSAGLFSGGIGVYATFVHVDTRGTNADWTG